ncbi:MAG: hypothetical protein MJ097_03470 [Dorea sp.]|nr:hypothetical protein [Dorea sp.]
MNDRKVFTEKLGSILELALGNHGKIGFGDVITYFKEDQLNEEQLALVCDYLMSQKVVVSGYVPKGGQIHVGEEQKEEVALSPEEQNYLDTYTNDLKSMSKKTEEEKRLAYYLPKVVEEAMKAYTGEVFIGDLIQEGNMALMMAFLEEEEDSEAIMEQVRGAIHTEALSQAEIQKRDKRMVSKVSELDETIKQMSDEVKGKVAIDEVAESLGISEKDIADILSLTGESVDELEEEEESVEDMLTVLDKDDVIDLKEQEIESLGIDWGDDDGEDEEIVF